MCALVTGGCGDARLPGTPYSESQGTESPCTSTLVLSMRAGVQATLTATLLWGHGPLQPGSSGDVPRLPVYASELQVANLT